MWALVVKEFREIRRDPRTLAIMLVFPVMLLIVLGYADSFDVPQIPTVVAGTAAETFARQLPSIFHPVQIVPRSDGRTARRDLQNGQDEVAVMARPAAIHIWVDGVNLFAARTALTHLAQWQATASRRPAAASPAPRSPRGRPVRPAVRVRIQVLYNPGLKTSPVMVPGLAGVVVAIVGVLTTSLGIVRERRLGTLDQLAIMPLGPGDIFGGKVLPYF